MTSVMTRRAALIAAVGLVAGLAWMGAAQAAPVSFKVALSGAESVPPVDTAGTGMANITYDRATKVVTWTITCTGLSATATMAHFHGPAEKGKNGPVVVWLTKQGSPADNPMKGEATLTAEQAQEFESGMLYINVHTQAHPGGEIRGQVVPPKS